MITVKQLKEYIRDLPEDDASGEAYEVWIVTGDYRSSVCVDIERLNEGDVILTPATNQ